MNGISHFFGGKGDDVYYIDKASASVFEAAGGGTDTLITSVSYTLAAGSEVELVRTYGSGSTQVIDLTDNEFANTLVGNVAANILHVRGGADVLWRSCGYDTYYVGNAGDTVTELSGQGTDTIITNVSFALAAGSEIELLRTYGSATTQAVSYTHLDVYKRQSRGSACRLGSGGAGR